VPNVLLVLLFLYSLTFSQNLNDVAALNHRETYRRGNMPRPAEYLWVAGICRTTTTSFLRKTLGTGLQTQSRVRITAIIFADCCNLVSKTTYPPLQLKTSQYSRHR
ncbi:hypothetical protein, partial [Methyloglobulus sp.]|uniref:hypothetical protein n=1 Tax=Methyloglobulus sp. TaxID=2518622 RepID=UPI0032B7F146